MTSTLSDIFTQHPELKHLRRALQLCKGFGLYFVSCNTVPLRNELVAALKANLATPIIELPLTPENDIFIDAQMAALLAAASADAIVFIYDLEKLYHLKDRYVIQELNWRREFYGRANHPVVFWMPDFLLTEIFNEAPDFADWRSGLYEFTLSQPEQLSLMQSTWESVGENFVGQLSLTEKERWIVNLENLLAELAGQEASKTKGDLLIRLGMLYKSLGKHDQALVCYQQSLQIQQRIGDKQGESATLNNISVIYHIKGDYGIVLFYLEQSLQICQDIGNKQGEGAILNNLSQIYHAQGDYDTALRYLKQSLQIRQDIGDKQGEGATLNNLSQIYKAKGDYGIALRYLEQSLLISQDIGDKQGEGSAFNNLSQIYHAQGDYDTALRYLEQSLQIWQDIGDKEGEGATLNNISQIYHAKGDYDTALRYLEQSLQIQQNIGDTAGECTTLFNIGLIHWQNDEQQQALSTSLKAYRMAKHIGLAQVLQSLDELAKDLGHEGLAWWETLNPAEPAE
ncbi:tetratricopeptide repeat protein [Methylovulum psychrotolerans]|uniref:Tetratricopeptide repeat-containing protein n=1 Tax=Methylovulum psychrotolerans TaxID=1704499 RepID=A0A2S5CP67_9GAMM|nr:tetratricopeptide repeat protein [Methylovulum psychrotolerans]POZ52594.1 tetratricopeptide repeat-containing protein [Methylovulum psychrotolerans]